MPFMSVYIIIYVAIIIDVKKKLCDNIIISLNTQIFFIPVCFNIIISFAMYYIFHHVMFRFFSVHRFTTIYLNRSNSIRKFNTLTFGYNVSFFIEIRNYTETACS